MSNKSPKNTRLIAPIYGILSELSHSEIVVNWGLNVGDAMNLRH